MENKKDILIYIGKFDDHNKYRLEEERAKYNPFIKNHNSMYEFFKWANTVTSSPLLKDKYLALVHLKQSYKQFEYLIDILEEYYNDYIRLIIIIEPRDRFFNLPESDFEVIDLSKHRFEDFNKYLDDTLPKMSLDARKLLIKRIGLNYNTLELFINELNALPFISKEDIKKIVKYKRILPIEQILYNILINGAIYKINQHYSLVEKYSESWTLNMYLKIVDNTIDIKRKMRSGNMDFHDLHSNSEYRNYIPLVRDINTATLFIFKTYINKYKSVGLEMYRLRISKKEKLLKLIESVEYEPLKDLEV